MMENRNYYIYPKLKDITIESLHSLKPKCCIVLCFGISLYSYFQNVIIKSHIFFGIKKPEIFYDSVKKIYSISLHSFCDICKFWFSQYIEGNKIIISKISEILYNGKNPILVQFIPLLQKIILYSNIVNENILNSSIIKKVMPSSGNLYINANFSFNEKINDIINYLKKMTKYSWYYMNDKKYSMARCSMFMNFVNVNDIFSIKEIFPNEVYEKVVKICCYIWYKNYFHFAERINIYSNGMFNLNLNKFPYNNIKSGKMDINNKKEEIVITLSDDEEEVQNNDGFEEDKIEEKEKINNFIYGNYHINDLNKSLTPDKTIHSNNIFNDMLNKKRKKEI